MSPSPASDSSPAQRHGIDVVPPAMHASPAQLPGGGAVDPSDAVHGWAKLLPAGDTPLWQPGALEIAASLGWRWVMMAPCLIIAIAPLPMLLLMPTGSMFVLSVWGLKLWLLGVGGAISLAIWGVRNVVRRRIDEFCIHCGYSLEGVLSDRGQCPECGKVYIPGICAEFRKDPTFFRRRVAALRGLPRGGGIDVG